MTTAVDSNVLLDVLAPNSPHRRLSLAALATALANGPLIISELVYAETAVSFADTGGMDAFMRTTGVVLVSSSNEALFRASQAWSQYLRRRPAGLVCPSCNTVMPALCPQCGNAIQSRQHLVADFAIGAHALEHAHRLLTRDRSLYRTYFPELELVEVGRA